MALNDAIVDARERSGVSPERAWHASAEVYPQPVKVGRDRAGAVFAAARAGANQGHSTKSHLTECPHSAWQEMARVHGLRGFNALPVVTLGCYAFGLQAVPFADSWEGDYLVSLYHLFYLEYNMDTIESLGSNRLMADLQRVLDFPGLSDELRLRRLHTLCDMAFFDGKRRSEALFKDEVTDGISAWTFRDRDRWRDFKAADSGSFPYYLSHPAGPMGRNDLMISGLATDWLDIGTDLRNSESGNSVLALTKASIDCRDLLDAYERTVWMLNDYWADDGDIKQERYAACVITLGVMTWAATNHRHDIWRYYALAADTSHDAARRDLGSIHSLLSDCYTDTFTPIKTSGGRKLTVPRSKLSFSVTVNGAEHTGDLMLHEALVQVVVDGKLPMDVINHMIVLAKLLKDGRITAAEFVSWIDGNYCQNAATIAHAFHAANFAREIGVALCALAMEMWWNGFCYAAGVGSLIEAQPGRVGHDREHG
ncbi:hypothetical protein [Actinomadura sp. DC4]|uniref:hypothetical protein n=1 Tax=Actinomadura sp. DC4 TaxID=3055069 RepID=UPI0025AF5B92|nr:hypothetical protein [Actinomadura sp. DC4]MDN3357652.1 hypothetical protein [Actinomadura sp. DC4]